jgi:hypothetical protein
MDRRCRELGTNMCDVMGCDRTWDLSGANVPSLLQQVQPASNWRFLGNAEQNGRDRGTIFSARTDWTTGGLGTSLGQMRRRDFSRYNRQAIGDSSAMLNKMAGTVGPSCWKGWTTNGVGCSLG